MVSLELLGRLTKENILLKMSYGRRSVLNALIERPSGIAERDLAKIVKMTRTNTRIHLQNLEQQNYVYHVEEEPDQTLRRKTINVYYADYPTLKTLLPESTTSTNPTNSDSLTDPAEIYD